MTEQYGVKRMQGKRLYRRSGSCPYTRLEQKLAMLEHYSEITNIILQTRHHKYNTLKEVKNSRSLYYCNIYHKNYLRATTATAGPEGTKYSWGRFKLCKKVSFSNSRLKLPLKRARSLVPNFQ